MRATKIGRWERFARDWLNFDTIVGGLVLLLVAGFIFFAFSMIGYLIYKDSQMVCKPGFTRLRMEDNSYVCSNSFYNLDWDNTYRAPK